MEVQTDDVPAYPLRRDERCPLDPPPLSRRMQHEQPIARVKLYDGRLAWLITRYADVRTVLADPRVSADDSRAGYPKITPTGPGDGFRHFVSMDPPEHDRFRRMLTRDFTVKRMNELRPVLAKIIEGVLDEMEATGPPLDLVQGFSLRIPSLAMCLMLGVPDDDHEFFQSRALTIVSYTSTVEQASKALDEVREYVAELIERTRACPNDTVVNRLVEQIDSGALELDDAISLAVLLLNGGHESTANQLSLGALVLMQDASLREDMLNRPEHVPALVEELLRYVTVAHIGRRRVAKEDLEIAGTTIRAGDAILTADPVANRDDSAFPDADRILLTRDASCPHLSFGWGIHQCLGQSLVRVELQIAYPALFRRFPGLQLAVPGEQVPFKYDSAVFGAYELPVRW